MCTDTGSEYQDCVSGSILPSGSAELCPYSQTACNENTSTPSCPSGYTWNGSTCTEQVTTTTSPSCPSGYTWNGSTCTETSNVSASGGDSSIWNAVLGGATASGNTITFYFFGWDGNGSFTITLNGATASGGDSNWNATLSGATASGNTITFYFYNGNGSFTITLNGATASGGENTNYSLLGATASGNTITFYYGYSSADVVGSFTITLNGTTQTTSPTCPSGYTYSNGTCTETTTQTASATCPSGSTLSGGQCISYTCPLGSPQGQAPGQSDTCVEPSGSSTYYCSPYLCYNDTTNTPVSSTETMPPPQTNNGTVTSSGCQGNIYIFPGQALQCIRDYALGENCCSRGKFLAGGRNCSSNSQILAEAIIYDNQYSPPVPVYSGSGDMNTAPITSCSQSAIDNNACGQLGEAIYLGNYCSLKLPLVGTCLAQEYVFCKFQGLLATLIQAQGRAQLAGGPEAVSWGTPQSPNCTGLTPAQFQALNFSNMNLSEYIAVVKSQATNTLNSSTIQTQIQNTTNSISNEVQQIESGGALTGSTP